MKEEKGNGESLRSFPPRWEMFVLKKEGVQA